MSYKLTTGWPQHIESGAFVNPDTNTAYLQWLAEGNTPLPADQPALDQVKATAAAAIDQAAGATRQKYITTSPGQEATYTEKARQCEAYKDAGYPATPDPISHAYVVAEANAQQCSYRVACDAILAERDQWAVLGAKIEEARRKAKLAVTAAVDAEAVDVALQTGLAELAAL
jgi:hypothetical protein